MHHHYIVRRQTDCAEFAPHDRIVQGVVVKDKVRVMPTEELTVFMPTEELTDLFQVCRARIDGTMEKWNCCTCCDLCVVSLVTEFGDLCTVFQLFSGEFGDIEESKRLKIVENRSYYRKSQFFRGVDHAVCVF